MSPLVFPVTVHGKAAFSIPQITLGLSWMFLSIACSLYSGWWYLWVISPVQSLLLAIKSVPLICFQPLSPNPCCFCTQIRRSTQLIQALPRPAPPRPRDVCVGKGGHLISHYSIPSV